MKKFEFCCFLLHTIYLDITVLQAGRLQLVASVYTLIHAFVYWIQELSISHRSKYQLELVLFQ